MSIYNPEFLYKNKITDVSQLSDSASTNATNRLKILDRNDELKYGSIGAASGTRTITWTPGTPTTIDRIAILGHNFSGFKVTYNGSRNFFDPAFSVLSNTNTNTYMRFNPQTVNSVTITVTSTMESGDLIKCAEIYIGKTIFTMSDATGIGQPLAVVPAISQKLLQLSDGTYNKVFIRRSFGFQIRNVAITPAERQNYMTVFEENRRSPFVFIPNPTDGTDTWDGILQHVHWANAPDFYNWTDDIAVNGYNVNIDLVAAGGLG